MIDLDRYADFLMKHTISPNQFLFLWLIMNGKYSLLYKYCEEIKSFSKNEIFQLVDKGFIEKPKEASGGALFADDFVVTKKFRSLVFAEDPEAMFQEFWNLYPNYLFINSKKVPTKGTNMEELEERYVKMIKDNLSLHNAIIASVEWGKQHGFLNTGILKFFESRAWDYIHQEMRECIEQGELPSQNEF